MKLYVLSSRRLCLTHKFLWYLIFGIGTLLLALFSQTSIPTYAYHNQRSSSLETVLIQQNKYHSPHTRMHAKITRRKKNISLSPTDEKVIVVKLSHQWLYAYQDGKQVFDAAVMTGRPDLPTPTGIYHILAKLSPTTFYSPWPTTSPYWYIPTTVKHALEFKAGGFFLHDSYWHTVYGPGMNGWHSDPVYGWQWGSHGCVSMPDSAASWLYNWAPIGTIVRVEA